MTVFRGVLCTLWKVLVAVFWGMVHFFLPPKPKSVRGDIVLITGAGSGLGQMMAVEFAKKGGVVVAWDINNKGNEETAKLVEQAGGNVFTYTVDVSDRSAIFKMGELVKKEVGEVDILINNAGIVSGKMIVDLNESDITKTMEVNLLAPIWTTKCFLPSMLSRNHGHIVTIASVAGLVGNNRMGDYCASKFGTIGFAESLWCEIEATGKKGINTTIVCPYYIATGMFDGCKTRFQWLLPRLTPSESAERIMTAVLTNQRLLYLPRIMYIMAVVKATMPVDAYMVIHKFLGASSLMDTYVGRQKKE